MTEHPSLSGEDAVGPQAEADAVMTMMRRYLHEGAFVISGEVPPGSGRRVTIAVGPDAMLSAAQPEAGDCVLVPRAVLREHRLAEKAYSKSRANSINRLDAAVTAVLSYEKAAPAQVERGAVEAPIPAVAGGESGRGERFADAGKVFNAPGGESAQPDERARCLGIVNRMAEAAAHRLEEGHDDDAAAQLDTATEIARAIGDPDYEREAAIQPPAEQPYPVAPSEREEGSWTGDPNALASELRRVANCFGPGFRIVQLFRDAADEIDCLATRPSAANGVVEAWQPIETAPYNQEVRVKAGDMTFRAMLVPNASMADEETSCDQWQATIEGEHPPCWSEGACWESNEDETVSLQPTHWMPLPPPLSDKLENER